MIARETPRRTRGLTLIELLAAVAIFIGLAAMVLQVLGGGLDLWSTGERTREVGERAAALLDRLAAELRQAVAVDRGEGPPDVQMYCDYVAVDGDSDGAPEVRAQRLLFVRRFFEQREHAFLWNAGEVNGDMLHYDGTRPPPGALLRATEGLVEVAFLPEPDGRPGCEGRLVLWRALRSPIGGEGSLLQSVADRSGGLAEQPMEPLAENLLHVGYEFVDPALGDAVSATWDSTRGLLPRGDGDEAFALAAGRGSFADPDDDVFPQAVRIVVVVALPPGEEPAAALLEELPETQQSFAVRIQGGRFLRELPAAASLVRVGHEWIAIQPSDGATLKVARRGALGSAVARHPVGTAVLVGHRFERLVEIPCSRSTLALPARDQGAAR